jgi:hypothetical protein
VDSQEPLGERATANAVPVSIALREAGFYEILFELRKSRSTKYTGG